MSSSVSFYTFGIYEHKSCMKNVGEIEPFSAPPLKHDVSFEWPKSNKLTDVSCRQICIKIVIKF